MGRPNNLFRSASSFALLSGLIAGGALIPGGIASAQDSTPPTAAKKTPVTEQEVIVTATKRKQKAQDVNLDLTVLGPAQLKNLPQIKSTQDAILFIPNAQGQTTEGQTRPRYFVRGIGTNNLNFNAVNPLGTYYDDIYIANVYDQALPIWDLDHIEALEGPQGTLWGKNANAGAINFISKAPTFTPDGYATLGYGSFGEVKGEGAFSDALIPGKVAGRLSFLYDSSDGWQRNIWNNKDYGGGSQTAVRQQFLITPTDDLSILLNFHLRRFDGDLRGSSYINDGDDGFLHGGTTITSPYYPTSRPPAIGYDQVDIAGPNTNHIDEKGGSAKVIWDPGKFTVTSITGYETNIWNEQTGSNNAPVGAAPYTLTTQNTNFWEFSQELRIASPLKDRFTWLAGLYGFADSESDTTYTGVFTPNTSQAGAFGSSAIAPQLINFPWTQDTHSYAGFGNLGYAITPRLKISVGGRWTTEHNTIDSAFGYIPGTSQAAYDALSSTTIASTYANQSNYTVFPTTATGPTYHLAQTQRPWTYDVTPEFKITDDIRTYFRYAHGVLPGNYSFKPDVVTSAGHTGSVGTVVPFALKPETLDAYEIGLKTQWFQHRLTANATIFHYDYNNAATNVPTPVPGIGSAVLFINAGGETVDGGDIELDDKITNTIHAGGNIGLLRAVYGQDSVNKADGIAGQQVPRSPHLTAAAYASYNEELPFGGNLLWAADANFRSRFFYYPTATTQSVANGAGLVDQQKQNAYAIVNTTITWYPTDQSKTSLQFSVQNLFDQKYTVLELQNLNGANGVYNGPPRSFFVSVTSHFF